MQTIILYVVMAITSVDGNVEEHHFEPLSWTANTTQEYDKAWEKSNMKPSEIIRMAMNHPSYLSLGGRDYLCHVIKYELALADDEETTVSLLIYDSIKTREYNHIALDSYLWEAGKIPDIPNIHKTQEYKQAAFAHWNALIEKLEKEGK